MSVICLVSDMHEGSDVSRMKIFEATSNMSESEGECECINRYHIVYSPDRVVF